MATEKSSRTGDETLQVTFELANKYHDRLLAELSDYDFNAFEQEDGLVKAYGPGREWTADVRERIRRWLSEEEIEGSLGSERWISPKNWNERWAQNIEPVRVEPFYITPTWCDVPEEYREWTVLEIDPKMTFGTGHHESTRLALRLISRWVEPGDVVLDAGAGTGILSVAATALGASRVIAFDNHPAARLHAGEVFRRHDAEESIEYRTGEIDVVGESGFSGILANITRNVLIELLPKFVEKLHPEGWIVLSGVMKERRDRMNRAIEAHELTVVDEVSEGEWYAVVVALNERP
jgi:ribosomal protein L11 methyltransferase